MNIYELLLRIIHPLKIIAGILASLGLALYIGTFILNILADDNNELVWSTPNVTHVIISGEEYIENIWSKSNVYMHDKQKPNMYASNGMLTMLGSVSQVEGASILVFDSSSSELFWKGNSGQYGHDTLYANSSAIYIGGAGFVTALEAKSGNRLWLTKLRGTRSVTDLVIWGDEVQANSISRNFFILSAETGEILEKQRYEFAEDIYLISNGIAYTLGSSALAMIAVNQSTEEAIWFKQVDDVIIYPPLFTNEVIFIRTGRDTGSVYAIRREDGMELWHTPPNIVSNVAFINSTVFMLSINGELLGLDMQNGVEVLTVKFDPSPFLLQDSEFHGFGYYVAANADEDIVFIYLGDGAQLFAFRCD